MDPNFKKDQPGKSPMGMDLVPVYADEGSADDTAGTVRILPNVVNNLGVRTEKVIQGRLPNDITTVGYVQYNEDEMIHVHPRVEGWIESLYVKAEGEPVEKGKALYTLYSPTLVNAQEELLLAVNRGNKRLVDAAEQRLLALNVPASLIRQLRQTREVQRTMTVGRFAEQYAELIEGIMPGDTVVISAQFLIDSESSKTSDFQRMAPPENEIDPEMDHSGHNMESMQTETGAAGDPAYYGVWPLFALKNTPVDALPDLSDVQVIIKTSFPGQAPQVVEDQVTYPMTTAMLSVPGAKTVRATRSLVTPMCM